MKLVEDLGLPARLLYLAFGALLMAATIATAWHDWPLVQAHKLPWAGFTLMLLVALPLSLLIMVWAGVGRHREWHVHDDHIHIHLISLTSWARTTQVDAAQIAQLTLDAAAYEDRAARTAYWLSLHLKDGRTLLSPKSFDKNLVAQAQQTLASKIVKAADADPDASNGE